MRAYEKLMQEYNLTHKELPNAAKIGIKTITKIDNILVTMRNTGKTLTKATLEKIEANDKWVVREILDYVEDKQENSGKAPNSPEVILAAVQKEAEDAANKAAEKLKEEEAAEAAAKLKAAGKEDDEEPIEVVKAEIVGDERAGKIDTELKVLMTAGVVSLTLADIKSSAPTAYSILFDAYEVDGENGVETTHYRLVETSKEVFALSKRQ